VLVTLVVMGFVGEAAPNDPIVEEADEPLEIARWRSGAPPARRSSATWASAVPAPRRVAL